ncbi:type I-E CRISPR-associated protein Cse1/CasA [Olsenella massiliensis]|uniref:type I-E CRISPR-associated protein Cse1/CasA n=1 Tax=Olsenella massiliensis TaxID=1622075 RepID=UPI00071D4FB3|nr:type I-E CRISPR-associated protein Cse1/CasA [Olsenella massiliensis]
MAGPEQPLSFNLLEEGWIPVVYRDGSQGELTLGDVFAQAPRIRTIEGDVRQQTFVLLRLLLAVLYRSHLDFTGTEADLRLFWKESWEDGAFDLNTIDAYLDRFHDRFDLFDPEHPFFQTPGLRYVSKEYDSVGEMVADVPKPEKFLFSMRDQHHLDSLGFAEAARWLVFMQAFDPAGIKSPVVGNTHQKAGRVYAPQGALGTGVAGALGGIFVEGDNLFQTLMLNWVLYDSVRSKEHPLLGVERDLPSWEQDDRSCDMVIQAADEPYGPVGMYVAQSRRVRLVPDASAQVVRGVISCYGTVGSVLDKQHVEPMTAWRESPAQQKKLGLSHVPLMPLAHDPAQSLWRGLGSVIAARGATGEQDLRPGVIRWIGALEDADVFEGASPLVTLHAQGMVYGTQSSVFSEAIDDSFAIPAMVLRDASRTRALAVQVVEQAANAADALGRFMNNIRRAAGDRGDAAQYRAKTTKVKEEAFREMDGLCRERLRNLDKAEQDEGYFDAWRNEIRRIIWAIGHRSLSTMSVSYFEVHDKMSVGRALQLFEQSLDKALPGTSKRRQ